MTTKFSSVYDDLRTTIASVLSGYTEFNNPYIIEDDSDLIFDNAWALGIGVGTNTNRVICNKSSVRREFPLTIMKRFFASDRDIDKRIAAEKSLLNAQLDVINGFEEDPTTSNIVSIRYVADNGIEFLGGDRWGFLVIQTILEVEYLDSF